MTVKRIEDLKVGTAYSVNGKNGVYIGQKMNWAMNAVVALFDVGEDFPAQVTDELLRNGIETI